MPFNIIANFSSASQEGLDL